MRYQPCPSLCFPVNSLCPVLQSVTCHPPPMSSHFALKKQSLLPYSPGTSPVSVLFLETISVVSLMLYPLNTHCHPCPSLSLGCVGTVCVLLLPSFSSLLRWLAHLPFRSPFLIFLCVHLPPSSFLSDTIFNCLVITHSWIMPTPMEI